MTVDVFLPRARARALYMPPLRHGFLKLAVGLTRDRRQRVAWRAACGCGGVGLGSRSSRQNWRAG